MPRKGDKVDFDWKKCKHTVPPEKKKQYINTCINWLISEDAVDDDAEWVSTTLPQKFNKLPTKGVSFTHAECIGLPTCALCGKCSHGYSIGNPYALRKWVSVCDACVSK